MKNHGNLNIKIWKNISCIRSGSTFRVTLRSMCFHDGALKNFMSFFNPTKHMVSSFITSLVYLIIDFSVITFNFFSLITDHRNLTDSRDSSYPSSLLFYWFYKVLRCTFFFFFWKHEPFVILGLPFLRKIHASLCYFVRCNKYQIVKDLK